MTFNKNLRPLVTSKRSLNTVIWCIFLHNYKNMPLICDWYKNCVTPGGYTVVLKSEGAVKKHQSDVLGVYRMVDSYNDRPVYKQDGGENYIYYR